VLFAEGEALVEPVSIPQAKGVQFLSDGYGVSSALAQVAAALELPAAAADPGLSVESQGPDSEAEHMNSESPSAS
jgi:hypothetical protein